MRDLFFFPVAALVIAVIVGIAINFGEPEPQRSSTDILRDGFELSGANMRGLIASPGTGVKFTDDGFGGIEYATLTAQISLENSPPSIGVMTTIGEDVQNAFAEKDINVTVRARQNAARASKTFKIGYYALDGGASGWRDFTVTPEFQNYTFEWRPGSTEAKGAVDHPEVDYIGIWPAPGGDNEAIDIEWIRVKVNTPKTAEIN